MHDMRLVLKLNNYDSPMQVFYSIRTLSGVKNVLVRKRCVISRANPETRKNKWHYLVLNALNAWNVITNFTIRTYNAAKTPKENWLTKYHSSDKTTRYFQKQF